ASAHLCACLDADQVLAAFDPSALHQVGGEIRHAEHRIRGVRGANEREHFPGSSTLSTPDLPFGASNVDRGLLTPHGSDVARSVEPDHDLITGVDIFWVLAGVSPQVIRDGK